MRKRELIILLSFFMLACSKDEEERVHSYPNSYSYRSEIERAYFEGQMDAINGNFKIKMNKDSSHYIWSHSPWKNGEMPEYDPSEFRAVEIELCEE